MYVGRGRRGADWVKIENRVRVGEGEDGSECKQECRGEVERWRNMHEEARKEGGSWEGRGYNFLDWTEAAGRVAGL